MSRGRLGGEEDGVLRAKGGVRSSGGNETVWYGCLETGESRLNGGSVGEVINFRTKDCRRRLSPKP